MQQHLYTSITFQNVLSKRGKCEGKEEPGIFLEKPFCVRAIVHVRVSM